MCGVLRVLVGPLCERAAGQTNQSVPTDFGHDVNKRVVYYQHTKSSGADVAKAESEELCPRSFGS